MKKLCVAVIPFFLVIFAVASEAAYQIKLSDGSEVTWESYTTEGDFFCTQTIYGKKCLTRKEIVSITEIKDTGSLPEPEDTTVKPSESTAFSHGYTRDALVQACRNMVSKQYDSLEFVTDGGTVSEKGGSVWLHVRRTETGKEGQSSRVSYFTSCTLEKQRGRWQLDMKLKEM